MALRIFTSPLRGSVNILPLFTLISKNNCQIILCCEGGHQSFLAAGKRKFLIFFISIPVMYRIDNVSSEKILIQFINLFTD